MDHLFAEDMAVPGSRRWRRVVVPLFVARHVLRLRARGEAPDLVEVHEPLGAPYAVLRALTLRRWLPPMVAFSHGLQERGWKAQQARWRKIGRRGPLRSRLLIPLTLVAQARIALWLADVVVVLSTEDLQYLENKRCLRPSCVQRIDNGVERELLDTPRPSRSPGGANLLFVGQWIDRKGGPELAEAFSRLCRDHPASRLLVAGSGIPATDVLSDFPASVRGNVAVIESVSRPELHKLLGQADLFALPSWFEGMPLSLLEAAAAGLPVVATDTCGIRDVLRPEDPGRDGGTLVPPHDSEALHAALDELTRDAALREELGARARARAAAFTWSHSAAGLQRAYRTAVDGRGRRSSWSGDRKTPVANR